MPWAWLVVVLVGAIVSPAWAAPEDVAVTPRDPLTAVFAAPTLAVDPQEGGHLAVAYANGNQLKACHVAVSHDGGETWEDTPLLGRDSVYPFPEGTSRCYPRGTEVAFGPDGTLYYVANVASSAPYGRLVILTSTDGGETFDQPRTIPSDALPQVAGRGGGDFRPKIRVDGAGGSETGILYVTWTRFGSQFVNGDIVLASSDDGGSTFGSPTEVSPISHRFATYSTLSVAPSGNVHVSWVDISVGQGSTLAACNPSRIVSAVPAQDDLAGFSTIHTATSDDGGATFGFPVRVADFHHSCRFFAGTYPVAVGPAGDAYLAWTDAGGGDLRVLFSRSDDGGATWAESVELPHSTPAESDRLKPWVDVAPNGRIDVAHYAVDPAGGLRDTYLVSSSDMGSTFSVPERLNGVSSPTSIGRGVGDPGVWVVSDDESVAVAWSDSRRGNASDGHQDIYFSRVPR